MSLDDKIKNAGENLGGKFKEAAGKVTGNKDTEAEGKADQVASDLKDKAADVKDKVQEVAEGLGANLKAAAGKVKEGFSSDDEK